MVSPLETSALAVYSPDLAEHDTHSRQAKVKIYTAELGRQIISLTSAVLSLVGVTVFASFASILTPLVLHITGPSTIKVALSHMSGEHAKVRTKQKEVNEAELGHKNASDFDKEKLEKILGDAKKSLTISKLGCLNNWMFLGMGFGRMTACALLTVESLQKVFHVLTISKGAETAMLALHVFVTLVYFSRGATLVVFARKNLLLIDTFSKDFNAQSVAEKIAFMIQAEEKGGDYLSLRMDPKCLNGMKAKDCISDTDKVQYLRLVEKAIFSLRLKHVIGELSGCFMMAGAIFAAVSLCTATGGTLFFAVAMTSALCFAMAEIHFLIYYNPTLFKLVLDSAYNSNVEIGDIAIIHPPEITLVCPAAIF